VNEPVASEICYFRASVRPQASALTFGGVRESYWVAHFYVQTEDSTATGAVGSQFCADRNLEFLEFLCLPQAISRSQIAEHEAEHIKAYECALREGIAVVVCVVGGLEP
jgi:hypothetical protein